MSKILFIGEYKDGYIQRGIELISGDMTTFDTLVSQALLDGWTETKRIDKRYIPGKTAITKRCGEIRIGGIGDG